MCGWSGDEIQCGVVESAWIVSNEILYVEDITTIKNKLRALYHLTGMYVLHLCTSLSPHHHTYIKTSHTKNDEMLLWVW